MFCPFLPRPFWGACCAENLLSLEWILALSIFCSVLQHTFNKHELRASTPSVCSADGSGGGFSKIILSWVQESPGGLWTYVALRGLGKGGALAVTCFITAKGQRDPSLTLAWGPAFHSCSAPWVWKMLGKGVLKRMTQTCSARRQRGSQWSLFAQLDNVPSSRRLLRLCLRSNWGSSVTLSCQHSWETPGQGH